MEQLFPLAQTNVLIPLLNRLAPSAIPVWGSMNAQQMIEHLESTLLHSIGDMPVQLLVPPEKLPQMIEWLHTEKPLTRGFRNPLVKEGPNRYPDLETAIHHMVTALAGFFRFYAENPAHQAIHIVFGSIGYEDWQRFHQKHFRHHFTQFGLLEE